MIPYVRDIDFEYGRCDQVSPLIRRVVANNPGPFTFTGTGTYIVGRGEVAVIDPGPDLPEHLEAILAAVKGETVTHILITHHHADHSPLAAPLKAATGAAIYGCEVESPAEAEESVVKMESGHDFDFRPDVSVCGGATIAGKGWTIEAIPTPGHTSNHICFALAEENALFSGDHIMGWSTTVITPPDGDMGAYFDSLDRIKARGFSTLWPTHGPPVLEVDAFIGAYIAHRRQREAQVLRAVGEGHGRIREMVPVLYADVDPRLHPAAARSVLAHLVDLTQRGKVVTDGEPGPDSRYEIPASPR
jgi:glyoxylase-like metal-dependent hydrolase (beta-lactamase superfamily II)